MRGFKLFLVFDRKKYIHMTVPQTSDFNNLCLGVKFKITSRV